MKRNIRIGLWVISFWFTAVNLAMGIASVKESVITYWAFLSMGCWFYFVYWQARTDKLFKK